MIRKPTSLMSASLDLGGALEGRVAILGRIQRIKALDKHRRHTRDSLPSDDDSLRPDPWPDGI